MAYAACYNEAPVLPVIHCIGNYDNITNNTVLCNLVLISQAEWANILACLSHFYACFILILFLTMAILKGLTIRNVLFNVCMYILFYIVAWIHFVNLIWGSGLHIRTVFNCAFPFERVR